MVYDKIALSDVIIKCKATAFKILIVHESHMDKNGLQKFPNCYKNLINGRSEKDLTVVKEIRILMDV